MISRFAVALFALAALTAPAWADPVTDATSEIVKQWGVPGAIIVILGGAVVALAYKLGKTQDARLEDHRGFAKQIADLNTEYNTASHDAAKTTAAQSVAIENINNNAEKRWADTKGTLDRLDDKLDPLLSGVAANGSSLGRMEADIRDIRNHATGQRSGGGR